MSWDEIEHVYCENCGDCIACDPDCYCRFKEREEAEEIKE